MFTRQGPSDRRAITLRRPGLLRARAGWAAGAGALAAGAACAAIVAPPAALAASKAPAVTFTHLTLINGWHTYPGADRPAVADINGIITFKGDITTNGTNPVPFQLPKQFRPDTNVFLITALCSANEGRLDIQPDGMVQVEAEDNEFSNAACVTELGGLSYARTAASFTKLKLRNGWQNAPFQTSDAAVRLISGVVHFKGAITTNGTSSLPFLLPKGFRPAHDVLVPVDLCDANKGRLEIQPDGVVQVEAEISFSDATCFTSLDGVTFATSSKSFTLLKLHKGWHPYGIGTYKPAVQMRGGIVRFEGAIRDDGDPFAAPLFILPRSMRPAKSVYVEVDLFNANNGRLYIRPNGQVFLYAEGGTAVHAQKFTSLDGAWFAR
jgi:hypothetical protein